MLTMSPLSCAAPPLPRQMSPNAGDALLCSHVRIHTWSNHSTVLGLCLSTCCAAHAAHCATCGTQRNSLSGKTAAKHCPSRVHPLGGIFEKVRPRKEAGGPTRFQFGNFSYAIRLHAARGCRFEPACCVYRARLHTVGGGWVLGGGGGSRAGGLGSRSPEQKQAELQEQPHEQIGHHICKRDSW